MRPEVRGGSLTFPFHVAPLILVAVFTLGLLIALSAGMLGLWLALLLLSWFFKYCFVLLDAIVAGDEEPPVLSVEMVNPVSEQRPLAAGALIASGFWLIWIAHRHCGNLLSIPVAGVLLAVLPASLAVLGITRNPARAIWPGAWIACIRGIGRDYLALCAAMLAFGAALYGMWRAGAPPWLTIMATQMLFLLMVAFIGSAVHKHRHPLGVPTLTRMERLDARRAREHQQARRAMLDDAYGLCRVRKPQEAWTAIDAWLTAHAARTENIREYREVFEAVLKWDEPRIGDRVTDDLIEVLLAHRETGVAVEVCEKWVAVHPEFEPASARRLSELASLAGKRMLARRLNRSTPGDP